MRKILGCFIIIMIMITSQLFAGTIYYVDATNGSDSNSGTSPEIAWKTINKVNNSSFNPGDSILFKKGEIWREQLIVPSSGSSGNPITFGAYGSGDDPIINGAEVIPGWTNYNGNVWQAFITTEPKVVILDKTIGSHKSSIVNCSSANDWYWDSNILYFYSTTDPDTKTVEAGKRDNAILVDMSIDYISIDGINVQGANAYAILSNANYTIIQNCTAEFSYEGFRTYSSADNTTASNCTVQHIRYRGIQFGDTGKAIIDGCTITDVREKDGILICGDYSQVKNCSIHEISVDTASIGKFHGIYAEQNADNILFENNEIYNCYGGNGINLKSDSGDVRYNYIHNGKDAAIVVEDEVSGGTINIYYNIFRDNFHGIWLYDNNFSANMVINIYNNVFYNNTYKYDDNDPRGFEVEIDVNSLNIKNNIFYHSSATDNVLIYMVSQSNLTMDYNCMEGSRGDDELVYYNSDWRTLSEWRTLGYDANGMKEVPRFLESSNHNFHLRTESPCINFGTDVGLAQDIDGNTVPNGWAVDIGAYEYQGSVSPPLSAEINASPTSGYVPLAVSFTGSASGGTAPYSYSWDFGDGSSSSEQNPSLTYSSASTYTVTLTVTDSSSNQATDSLIITASSPSTPLSGSASSLTTSGEAPLTVNFTGSASGGTSPYNYSWNFGDGQSSSSQNPAHTYSSAGNYIVILTVTDSKSSTATDSLTINVQEKTSSLAASASASPTSGQVPLTVSFTGSASGGTAPYNYSWNFGDGSSSSSQNPSHTYSSAGTYSVTLTVTDSASSQATASITITAQTQISALAASCTASPTSGDIPLTVNFTGTAAGGISPYTYSWNFGDGASSTAQNPSHTYTQAGSYTITLTVTDSALSQATASTEITASSPVHEVTAPNTPEGPSTGAPGVSYTYTTGGSSCSQGHSVEYYFDWGDGTYSSWSSSTSASHIWSAAGTYSVKVQARCSVNPGVTSLWSEAKTVSLEESSNFQLYISSATASPAPGQGGSTNPNTGRYPYPAGNTAQVTALPAANYRFSKWTGDISGSDSYNSEITFNMDQDKSISALFCTQCGDVNGDLSITPADAQDAFEMFLGIISNATETQKENADVNCDGTATEPNITPADAQAIFEKFLGISELPGDCSCRSRADASSTAFTQNNRSQTAPLEIQSGTPTIQLTIDDIDARFKREITVPVRINNPLNIKSFGFDLIFDSGTLEFAGIEIGSLLNGFTMVDANEISEGVVRVGGFSSEPILTSSPSVLVRLKFRVLGRAKEPSPLSITNTVDDIKNVATRPGVVFYKEINDKIMRNKNVF